MPTEGHSMEYPAPDYCRPHFNKTGEITGDMTAADVLRKQRQDACHADNATNNVWDPRSIRQRMTHTVVALTNLTQRITNIIESMEGMRIGTLDLEDERYFTYAELVDMASGAAVLSQHAANAMRLTNALTILRLKCDGIIPLDVPEDFRGSPVP